MAGKAPFVAACIEFNPKLKDWQGNLDRLYSAVEEAARRGARLIVTPEMATTGYHFRDRRDIAPFADTIPGVTTARFAPVADKYGAYIVIGMPEADPGTGIYYNSAALVGPGGFIGKYRKCHIWETEAHWAACGDLGFPVFSTELGNIAINICMDSVYFESARIPALHGADILAYLTNSTAQGVAMLQDRAETNGLYIVSANRSDTENGYHMIGASAVWSPDGEKLAETPFVPESAPAPGKPVILYATIDPARYDNPAKRRLAERRPELYHELMLYISPWDSRKSGATFDVDAALIQYEPVPGDKEANLAKAERLLRRAAEERRQDGGRLRLAVLPELSFTGPVEPSAASTASAWAEPQGGPSAQRAARWAAEYGLYILFSWIEKQDGRLFISAGLADPDGRLLGVYRKTHLAEPEKAWATAGGEIPVFATGLGRIGIMIGRDACFPEVAGVLAAKRADIILVPSAWKGEFGRELDLQEGIAKHPYPAGSQTRWNAIAWGAQAYTLVANFTGTAQGFRGRSGLYALDPLYGLDRAAVASADREEGLTVRFSAGPVDWWFNQDKLIASRKPWLYKSLIK